MIEEPCQTARLFLLTSAAEVLLLMMPLSFSWISSPVDMFHVLFSSPPQSVGAFLRSDGFPPQYALRFPLERLSSVGTPRR